MLAKGDVPGWLLYMSLPKDPRNVCTASCLCLIICNFLARSLLYIGPNLFRPPLILSARTAEKIKAILKRLKFGNRKRFAFRFTNDLRRDLRFHILLMVKKNQILLKNCFLCSLNIFRLKKS